MRGITVFLGFFLVAASAPHAGAQTPLHLWREGIGGLSSDNGSSVAMDASGNVFVTGLFSNMVDFGGGLLGTNSTPDQVFLAKYSAAGTYLWSKKICNSTQATGFPAITTDASGNVFVTGGFIGVADFGNGNVTSAGDKDIFLVKCSPTGAYLWSGHYGNSGLDYGSSVATDAAGNVYFTGVFTGTVNFGNGNLYSQGNTDIFVVKKSSTGSTLWSQRFGEGGYDYGSGVATDAAGDVFAVGAFQTGVDFGGGMLTGLSFIDAYIAEFDPSGTHLWSKDLGSTDGDFAYSAATDNAGNVFVTGAFAGTADFGGGNLVSAGSNDIFIVKYGSTGTHLWSQRFGGTGDDEAYSIAIDASGDAFVTGSFQASVDFGGGPLVTAGGADIFVAKYDASGAHVWSERYGDTSDDVGRSVSTDDFGTLFATGTFQGTMVFGDSSMVSAGGQDIYVVKLGSYPGEPRITSIADIGNDQGRKVKIRFRRSGWDDAAASNPVTRYVAFRRDDAPPAVASHQSAGQAMERPQATGWTEVGSVGAYGDDTYGMDVPTIGDSTIALGQYLSVFYIRAATDVPTTFYDSSPDSGYSLDNLAPGIPQNFVYTAGNLSWDQSTASDFDYFTVYGANSNDFGAAAIVDYSVSPAMDVAASPYAYYYVTATDFSGNEGKPNTVHVLSGVGDTPKHYVLALSNYPNPFNPRTTVRYTLPSRGHVTIDVYDASGAHVATLFDGERSAGAYSVGWDGRTASGAIASSGVYFARIEHPSGVRTKKMVLLK